MKKSIKNKFKFANQPNYPAWNDFMIQSTNYGWFKWINFNQW